MDNKNKSIDELESDLNNIYEDFNNDKKKFEDIEDDINDIINYKKLQQEHNRLENKHNKLKRKLIDYQELYELNEYLINEREEIKQILNIESDNNNIVEELKEIFTILINERE